MAIIYTYPTGIVYGDDRLIVSEMDDQGNPTKNITVAALATFITGTGTGTGTTNTIPLWTDGPSGLLGDSIITQDAGATTATITGATVSTGQVTIPPTPVAATDAASKGYVDSLLSTFVFTQVVPAATWVIIHGLNKFPSVSVVDTADTGPGFGAVEYNNANQLTITFSGAFAGKAFLN
jgi:hypothetical protein